MNRHDKSRHERYFDRERTARALRQQVTALVLPIARSSRTKTALGHEDPEVFRAKMLAHNMTWWNFEPGPDNPDVRFYIKGLTFKLSGRKYVKLAALDAATCEWLLSLTWIAEQPYSPLEQLARLT